FIIELELLHWSTFNQGHNIISTSICMLNCSLSFRREWFSYLFVHDPGTITYNVNIIFSRCTYISIYSYLTFCYFKTRFSKYRTTSYSTSPNNYSSFNFFIILTNNKTIRSTLFNRSIQTEFNTTVF